jgi:hypothetical protein
MTNPGGTKTASNLPISVDPHGARINYSLALVSLPSTACGTNSGVGWAFPSAAPFSRFPFGSLVVCTKVTVRRCLQFRRHQPSHGHASCTASRNRLPAIQQKPPRVGTGSPQGVDFTLRRSLYAWAAPLRLRADTCHRRALVWSPIYNEEGVPDRGTEHPRAFALAPGGDSGAVPTAMAIRAGAEMASPNGRRHRQFCALTKCIQWRRGAWRGVDREFL